MRPHHGDERVTLWHGDALEVLRSLADSSVDSVVTDPPYGLEFMGREWDGADGFRRSLNPADAGRDNAFGRTSRTSPEYRAGALFQEWCEAWATECLRVLKPGGHMLAFGGTRTWHRLACAVEDAGFEVRDSIAWMYSQGFPKSMNPGRDQRFCQGCEVEYDHADSAPEATEHGLSGVLLGDVSQTEGTPRGARPVLLPSLPQQGAPAAGRAEPAHDVRGGQPSLEGRGDLQAAEGQLRGAALREVPGGPAVHGEVGRLRDGAPASDGSSDRATAAEVGSGEPHQPRPTGQPTGEPGAVPEQRGSQTGRGGQVCAGCGKPPAPVGLGTALKPAFEPVVVARKPLSGTVAATVLAHGTGALNVDACRVGDGGQLSWAEPRGIGYTGGGSDAGPVAATESTKGRWPANVLLDDSQAAELDRQSGALHTQNPETRKSRSTVKGSTEFGTGESVEYADQPGTGASRFFPTFRYEAKAPSSERPRIPRNVLRLRADLTPAQVDHVRARLTEAGVQVD